MVRSILFNLLLIASLHLLSQTPNRKVLFIGIDGCRADALIASNAPTINGLLSNAIYSTDALTEYATWSGTGWSGMLTGAWHTKHGVTDNSFSGSNYGQYPDFISRVENHNPNLHTVSVVHWSPINTNIVQAIDNEYTEATDIAVRNRAVNVLNNSDPDVLFVAFDDVDHAGHLYGYSPTTTLYLDAINTADTHVSAIMTALHNRPNYANEDWLVILTTDHGGTPTGHGGGTLEERNIFAIYHNNHFTAQPINRRTLSQAATFNEARFGLGSYATPASQTPFQWGTNQDFSIEFWVKANAAFVADPAFIGNKDWDSGNNAGFVISAQSGQYWKVNIGDGTDRQDIQGGFISPNQWHHIAVSFDRNGLMTAYEDGIRVGSARLQNIGNINSGLPLIINQDGTTNYGYNFAGSLRDIRIWNAALPNSVLLRWANIPLTTAHPYYNQLLANWNCGEGTGNTLQDSSPNANHCSVTGSLTWANNQNHSFVVYDYTHTPSQPDNAVTALNWLDIPIQSAWNLDGRSWVEDQPIYQLNDEFDQSATLSHWQNTNIVEGWNAEQLETYNINTNAADKLYMMPYTCGWYNEWRGPLLFKSVSGDFVFTTEVSTSNRAGNGLPQSDYSLAGLMIRTPLNYPNGAYGAGGWTSGQQDYVFLSIGYGDDLAPCTPATNGPHFEVKSTDNSNSTLCVSPIASTTAQIRLARIGSAIFILYRLPGGEWTLHQRYNRPDLPNTVQVGFVTYTDWNKWSTYTPSFANSHVIAPGLNPDPSNNPSLPFNPDLVAIFEYARFELPRVPPSLAGVDLVSSTTNAQLLDFLGYGYCMPTTLSSPTQVCANGVQTYSVAAQANTVYTWTVQGGTLLSGQGTNSIQVLWDNGTAGTVSVLQTVP